MQSRGNAAHFVPPRGWYGISPWSRLPPAFPSLSPPEQRGDPGPTDGAGAPSFGWKYRLNVSCTASRRSLQITYIRIASSTLGTSWSMSGSCWPANHSVPPGVEREPADDEDTGCQIAIEMGHGRQRVVADRLADVQGDLRRHVELLVSNLVEDRVVALVADPREAGQGGVAEHAGQIQMVEPRETHGRPATPDENQGVEGPLHPPAPDDPPPADPPCQRLQRLAVFLRSGHEVLEPLPCRRGMPARRVEAQRSRSHTGGSHTGRPS